VCLSREMEEESKVRGIPRAPDLASLEWRFSPQFTLHRIVEALRLVEALKTSIIHEYFRIHDIDPRGTKGGGEKIRYSSFGFISLEHRTVAFHNHIHATGTGFPPFSKSYIQESKSQ
jgi:hypothetical protein